MFYFFSRCKLDTLLQTDKPIEDNYIHLDDDDNINDMVSIYNKILWWVCTIKY